MDKLIDRLEPQDNKPFLLTLKKILSDSEQLLVNEISKGDEGFETLSSLVAFYLKCPSKYQVKRLMASYFQNLRSECQIFVEKKLCSQLLFPIPSDIADKENASDIRKSVDNINFLLENFLFGERCLTSISQESLIYLIRAEEYFLSHVSEDVPPVYLNEVMHHCLVTMQTLNLVIQKLVKDKPGMMKAFSGNEDLMASLIGTDVKIIQNELLLLDCRCCCAMNVFLLIQISLPLDKAVELVPNFLFPDENDDGNFEETIAVKWLLEKRDCFCMSKQTPLSYLVIAFGYIAMMTPEKILQESKERKFFYVDELLPHLLTHGERCEDTVSKALLGKTVNLWTTRLVSCSELHILGQSSLKKLQGGSPTVDGLLQYVWTHWEDQLDVMRQSAKTVFENVLKIHVASSGEECKNLSKSVFISSLLTKMFNVSWTSRGKFSALSSCVIFVGANCLLSQKKNFPSDVLNQFHDRSLSCYACELYMNTLLSHRRELSPESSSEKQNKKSDSSKNSSMTQANEKILLEAWIDPVISSLRFSIAKKKNNIIDYLLPRLLKSDRKFLDYMINKLSLEDDKGRDIGQCYGAIVTCLRRARFMGFLNGAPLLKTGEELWYGILHPDILRKTLCAQDEQVRLDAFAFLCESHKSTEGITSPEFEMLQLFILRNLNSQSPAFRQSFLGLLKKLFSRIKESLPPLKRRQKQLDISMWIHNYTSFLEWTCSLMLKNLHPGSSFARRITCLTSLSLMNSLFIQEEDGFSVSCYMKESHIETLLKCLADTFEDNNLEALNILKHYTKFTGQMTTPSRLQALFQMSLRLACSTRPQDCGTAAYIMLLLLNQSNIYPLIKNHKIHLKTNTAKEMLSKIDGMFSAIPFYGEDKASIVGGQAYATLYLLHVLVVFLHDQNEVARQSLITAAASRPMYPTLQCIRYIMQEVEWHTLPTSLMSLSRNFIQLLIQTCLSLATLVSPVVQNSSPEGNIPADAILGPGLNIAELLPMADAVSAASCKSSNDNQSPQLPQSVLNSQMLVEAMPEYLVVCCWRSIKEVSLTLGKICLQISVPAIVAEESISEKHERALLSLSDVKMVGDYFTQQLLGSVHRGAFELAYAGFQLMCQMLWSHPHPAFHSLPAQWLTQIIHEIKSDDPNSKLCATRRSAGIPFFIKAITSSEPFLTGRQCFHSSMKELIIFALDEFDNSGQDIKESKDAQVHALNILKALYNDSRLREDVVPYIADGVKAAIRGFKSNLWSVRNTATLLLSTLMTRMFGVKRSKDETNISKKNCQTGRSFFYHYPGLYPFLLSELEEATNFMGPTNTIKLHPSLYPVLLVLGRLFPSMLEGSDTSLSLSAFIPYVLKCASSPILKTRIIAARALQPLAKRNQVVDIARILFSNISMSAEKSSHSSHIHGSLLQLCELVKLVRDLNTCAQESILYFFLCEMSSLTWLLSEENKCFATRQSTLQLLDNILDIADSIESLPESHGKLIRVLKTAFISSISQASSPQDKWKPLLYDYEKIRAVLSLKHLNELSDYLRVQQGISLKESNPDRKFKETIVMSFLQSSFYEVRLQVLYMFSSALSKQSHPHSESESEREITLESSEAAELSGHTLTDHLYSADDAATRKLLTSLATDLFDHILHHAVEVEEHHECLEKIFHILALIPNGDQLLRKKDSDEINKIFETILKKITVERRNEVKAAILKFSGHFIPFLYEGMKSQGASEQHELFTQWTGLVQGCCQVEEYPDLMVSVAHILLGNTSTLLCDVDQRIGLLSLHYWNILATLLQEDDLDVQEMAASVLAVASGMEAGSLHPALALEQLPDIFLSIHQDKTLCDLTKFLVSWVVQDTTADVKEPNERLFDRSESNSYKDYIAFTRCVTLGLYGLFHNELSDSDNGEFRASKAHSSILHTDFTKQLQDSDLIEFLMNTFDKIENELNSLKEYCDSTDALLNPLRHISLYHGIFRAKSLISAFTDVYRNENTIQLKISGLNVTVAHLIKLTEMNE